MEKTNSVEQAVNAVDAAITSRYHEQSAANGGQSPEEDRAFEAMKKFRSSLNEDQRAAYTELDNLNGAAAEVEQARFFKLGFYDGLAAGRAL